MGYWESYMCVGCATIMSDKFVKVCIRVSLSWVLIAIYETGMEIDE